MSYCSRVPRPLDPKAVTAANERLWADHPELNRRQLTMSDDPAEAACREDWCRAYLESIGHVVESPPPPKDIGSPVTPCPLTTALTVRVVDKHTREPLAAATVVLGLNGKGVMSSRTDTAGQARFSGLCAQTYDVLATRESHGQGRTQTVVVEATENFAELALRPRVIAIAWGPDFERFDNDGNIVPPGPGFALAAQTKENEIAARVAVGGPRVAFDHALFTDTTDDFVALFAELLAADVDVAELHFYSHSGSVDGPIFNGLGSGRSQFMTEAQVAQIPVINWTTGAQVFFYGCNAGYGRFIAEFATLQNVVAHGCPGFSTFSSRPNAFDPLDDPTTPPVYLNCFKGMAEISRRNGPPPSGSDAPARFFRFLHDCDKHIERFFSDFDDVPPLPMIRMPPRHRPVVFEDYTQRGDVVPVPTPL